MSLCCENRTVDNTLCVCVCMQSPAGGLPGTLQRHHVLARRRSLLLLTPSSRHLLPVEPPHAAQHRQHRSTNTVSLSSLFIIIRYY